MFFRNESMLSTAINNTASKTEYPIKKCVLDWASIGAFINAAGGREDNDSKNNKAIYFWEEKSQIVFERHKGE